jgi:hypothetical protein
MPYAKYQTLGLVGLKKKILLFFLIMTWQPNCCMETALDSLYLWNNPAKFGSF